MILFPNCKINIGLNVIAKRSDGYHEVETVMYPVRGLCDVLEIIHSSEPGVQFTLSGMDVEGDLQQNLCVKAYRLMQERFCIGGVKIHLHKVIPTGAGLGGGSADAAYVIKGLNTMFSLSLTDDQMERLAAELGSDTAFFIRNTPAYATGRGECLAPFDLVIAGYKLLLIKPNVGVSTAQAYAGVAAHRPTTDLREALSKEVVQWRDAVCNDFEPSVFAKLPLLETIKDNLYAQGALYAAMSGSGSTVYGLFSGDSNPDLDAFHSVDSELFVYQCYM